MKKRAWKRAVSAVLAAGMVLACTMASALAAEPDNVQEFRQGKTKMISAVDGGLLVVQEDGTLWGWGRANEGALGNGGGYDQGSGDYCYRTYPEKLMTDVAFVDGGGGMDGITVAIKTDGSLWYTGNVVRKTIYGMMVKEWEYQTTFQKLTDDVSFAAAGGSSIYAVKNNGELWEYDPEEVWEYGESGFDQSGNPIDGAYHYEFKSKKIMDDVEKLADGGQILALKKDGSVWAWGYNSQGQVGNGTYGSSVDDEVKQPVKVLENVQDLAVGYNYASSAAIKTDGSLWIWGSCPEGATKSEFSTKPIKLLDSVKDVSIHQLDFVALLPDDTIQAWGYFSDFSNAFANSNDSPIKDIEISLQVLFALKEDGSVWAIGNNRNPTFGMENAGMENGEKIERITTPVQLTGIEKTGSNENSTQTTPQTAAPTTSKVLVNGNAVSFDAYQINGNNYFKLRDIAKVLSGTDKQFEVTWDSAKNAINLISGQSYTPVGGELATGSGANQQAVLNTSTVYLDGKQINLTAYTIQGNNYFKLRGLGRTFDFGVGWDGANNTVTIDTNTGYTPE